MTAPAAVVTGVNLRSSITISRPSSQTAPADKPELHPEEAVA